MLVIREDLIDSTLINLLRKVLKPGDSSLHERLEHYRQLLARDVNKSQQMIVDSKVEMSSDIRKELMEIAIGGARLFSGEGDLFE